MSISPKSLCSLAKSLQPSMKFYFGQSGMEITKCRLTMIHNMEEEITKTLSQVQ